MKYSSLIIIALMTTARAFAATSAADVCAREVMAAAISQAAMTSTEDALQSGSFHLDDLTAFDVGTLTYTALVSYISDIDRSITTKNFSVHIVNRKRCKVIAKLIAG
jgi:hypothetical protein